MGTLTEQLEAMRANEKYNSRQMAISIAERLNPKSYVNDSLSGKQGEVSVDKVLKDADKIYDWLTKEL